MSRHYAPGDPAPAGTQDPVVQPEVDTGKQPEPGVTPEPDDWEILEPEVDSEFEEGPTGEEAAQHQLRQLHGQLQEATSKLQEWQQYGRQMKEYAEALQMRVETGGTLDDDGETRQYRQQPAQNNGELAALREELNGLRRSIATQNYSRDVQSAVAAANATAAEKGHIRKGGTLIAADDVQAVMREHGNTGISIQRAAQIAGHRRAKWLADNGYVRRTKAEKLAPPVPGPGQYGAPPTFDSPGPLKSKAESRDRLEALVSHFMPDMPD